MAGDSGDKHTYELNGHVYALIGAAFTNCLKCGEDFGKLGVTPCTAPVGEPLLVILAQIRDSLAIIANFVRYPKRL